MEAPFKRVLCIEDDRETAGLIAEELSDRGYAVAVAYDGRDGLAAIIRCPPDLVLADVNMPGMSGFALLERLTALRDAGALTEAEFASEKAIVMSMRER